MVIDSPEHHYEEIFDEDGLRIAWLMVMRNSNICIIG